MARKLKIIFLARDLGYGGAQTQLIALAKGLNNIGHSVKVLVFYPGGAQEQVLTTAGVDVESLGKGSRWQAFGFLYRLIKSVRRQRPEVLHGYLTLPNILTVILKLTSPRVRAVWGIRASKLDFSRYDRLERVLNYMEGSLSRFTDLIISNSYSGMHDVVARGFPKDKIIVVPNGIDTERFRPDEELRRTVRAGWGWGGDVKVLGLIGRLDPMKDHETFVKAAAKLLEGRADVRFLCVGDGPISYRQQLEKMCGEVGGREKFLFLGAQGDMPAIYNAIDILVSSSRFGEGFPNVIGEAMACGVPCVATDVGDSALVVGETGEVVRPGDPDALKAGMEKILKRFDHEYSGAEIRRRIVEHFSVPRLVRETEAALCSVVS